jgi:hypothetical protein
MKSKYKEIVAGGIAKEFWNSIDESLRLKVLEEYLYDYIYLSHYKTTGDDLILLTKNDWSGLALSSCDIPIQEIRVAVYCYLGIGDYESMPSGAKEYQREYKLRMLKLK